MLHAAYRNYLDMISYLCDIGVDGNVVDLVGTILL